MEELAKGTLSDVVARTATALEAAIKDHGPDAVELALFVYRVEAWQVILIGVGLLVCVSALGWMFFRVRREVSDAANADPEAIFLFDFFVGGGAFATSVFLVISGFARLLSIPHWAAAFGYPEVLIAYKALQSAGLI